MVLVSCGVIDAEGLRGWCASYCSEGLSLLLSGFGSTSESVMTVALTWQQQSPPLVLLDSCSHLTLAGGANNLRPQVLGRGISGSIGVVASINEQEGIATVRFPPVDCRRTSQAADTLTIPLSRLCVPRSEVRRCSPALSGTCVDADCCCGVGKRCRELRGFDLTCAAAVMTSQ